MSVLILRADARRIPLADESVNCVVTSPPYWGLRDYKVAGQIGLERTPTEYLVEMVAVFREVKRVLRRDGTLWMNMGDCYATGAGKVGECPGGGERGARWAGDVDRLRDAKRGYRGERLANGRGDQPAVLRVKTRATRDGSHEGKHTAMAAMGPMTQPNRMPIEGLKPKDLVGMPWRLAFALQADGWYLRSDIIWSKPNPMPESIKDRPTKAHEYIFLLAKSERYFYDADAIMEKVTGNAHARGHGVNPKARTVPTGWDTSKGDGGHGNIHREGRRPKAWDNDMGSNRTIVAGYGRRPPKEQGRDEQGLKMSERFGRGAGWRAKQNESFSASVNETVDRRNKRSVWEVPTQAYPDAHFATFPEALVVPCILAGCPVGGIVLDPFAGSGTTGRVAIRLNRNAVLLDLAYHDHADKRTRNVQRRLAL